MATILPGDRSKAGYDVALAKKFGVNVAIILSRIIWSIQEHIKAQDQNFYRDGYWWMYDSKTSFSEYSGLSLKEIRNAIKFLTDHEIINKKQYDQNFDKRWNWYSINEQILHTLLAKTYIRPKRQIGPKGPDEPKGPDRWSPKGPIDGAQRARSMEPKGPDPSLSNSLSESLTKNQTKSLKGGGPADGTLLDSDLEILEAPIPPEKDPIEESVIISPTDWTQILDLWHRWVCKRRGDGQITTNTLLALMIKATSTLNIDNDYFYTILFSVHALDEKEAFNPTLKDIFFREPHRMFELNQFGKTYLVEMRKKLNKIM